MRLVVIVTLAVALFATHSPELRAKYVVVSKAPSGFINRTQQKDYHKRLMQEIDRYDAYPDAQVREWYFGVSDVRGDALSKELKAAYRLANRYVRYQGEREDIWYTPAETISQGWGDCDDFAQLYIVSAHLLDVGWDRLWMVAGRIYRDRGGPLGHAIAVIDTDDGEQFVMDSLRGRPVRGSEHQRFKPVYAINMEEQVAFMQVNTAFRQVVNRSRTDVRSGRRGSRASMSRAISQQREICLTCPFGRD